MTLPVQIESSILPAEKWSTLASMAPELSKAYATRQIFRTETEMRVSVLDDIHYPTKAAKYWQCVREQSVMLEQLAVLSFEYRKNERTLASTADEIERDECEFRRAQMRTVAADRVREIELWSKIKAELDDGSFDTDNVNTHQLVSYTTRFALTAATVDKSQMSGDEYANLMGQLKTCIKRCKDVGALELVVADMPSAMVKQLQLIGI